MVGIKSIGQGLLRGTASWFARRAGMTAVLPGYDAAGYGRRNVGWLPDSGSVNAILFASADELRRRSHDQARKNPWAAKGISAFTTAAIGTGIKLQSRHPEEAGRKAVHEAFGEWVDECDASGTTDFYGLQSQAVAGAKEGGEVFARLRTRRLDDGMGVPLQIQLLEAEHVPTWLTQPLGNGNVIRAGIEFNGIGKRVAYWMYREHPGEQILRVNGAELVRVPADDVIHHFVPLRPGQVRGVPGLAPVLQRLFEFDHYEDAELVRKRDSAMFSGFIKETGTTPNRGPLPQETITDVASGVEIDITRLESGTWQKLRPGEEVTPAEPADMGDGYSEFMRWVLRAIAAGMGITYEQLTGDLTGVNYSSIRAGMIEFRRSMEYFQHSVFVFQFCRPIWRRWMFEAVLSGSLPVSATAYRRDPRPWLAAKWVPQGWSWVDPEKEIRAIVLAIRAGLMSRAEAVSQYGYDSEAIDAEIAADNARADKLKNSYDSDGRRAMNAGVQQTTSGRGIGDNGGPPLDEQNDPDEERQRA